MPVSSTYLVAKVMKDTRSHTVHLIIIGHTNTGKTSLMRTLLRDCDFGEVKNTSATTRHVEAVTLFSKDDTSLVTLYDTPGLEDATGVMDYLQEHTNTRLDGVERLNVFLQAVKQGDPKLKGNFTQEAKVVNALLNADIAIYVIDAREPILSKYKDELAILASAGTPVLPVFNFVKANRLNTQAWQEMLSRRALHIVNAFDTVAFDFDAEMSLWENLAALTHANSFKTLKSERTELWHDMGEYGSLLIADFLVNVASFSKKIDDSVDANSMLKLMQNSVRQAFDTLTDTLLNLYKFYNTPIDNDGIVITGKQQDIFDAELLTRYGIRTAGGSFAGMVIGAGIDVATFGASLGLGTALGGVLGGLLPNSSTIKDKAMGIQTLTINDETLTVLATQAQYLHHTLRHRGHASLDAINLGQNITLPWQGNKLPATLKKARAYPHYSSLDSSYGDKQNLRAELADKIAMVLDEHLKLLNDTTTEHAPPV